MKRNTLFVTVFSLLLSFLGKAQVTNLDDWLALNPNDRPALESLDFSTESLTQAQAEVAKNLLLADKQRDINSLYGGQWENRLLSYNNYQMPFFYNIFGDEPEDGRSLFISMHGGGSGAPAQNDNQYNNQKNLYDATMNSLEGVYLAVRAPTNVWNLWHLDHIDEFFNVIIQMAMIKENVNPNKVYLMGYSAGGDGVYQLAPRMADRWAAASMMAGHPNETSPLGLRNLPFTIHMGGDDSAFNRNTVATQWGVDLANLQNNDPGAYIHDVNVYPGVGHWMSLRDAVALPWMKNFERNPIPQKIVWKQDDVHHSTFYWVGVPDNEIVTGGEVVVEYDQVLNEINIVENYSSTLNIYINDDMLNLDAPISIKYQGQEIFKGMFPRSVLSIFESLSFKGDANLAFSSELKVINNEVVTGGNLITNTQKIDSLHAIKIYPNPIINNKFTVTLPSGEYENRIISLTDAQGNEVKRIDASGTNNEIDLSGLPASVYFVKTEANGQSFIHKVVKM